MEADITINGNVGAEVQWREHEEYEGRAWFSLGCTPSIRRNGVWVEGQTVWYRVYCWRRLATHVRDSLKKGDPVVVGGRLRVDRWIDESNIQREGFSIDASWVGHDLRRGTATFTRVSGRPEADAPFESDAEAERARALQDAADGEGGEAATAVDEVVVDADGVVLEGGELASLSA